MSMQQLEEVIVVNSDSGSRGTGREELSSAAISITPIPLEELDGDNDLPRSAGTTESPRIPRQVSPAPTRQPPRPSPTRGVSRYLFGSERYVGEWRRHWIHVVGWAALGIISPFGVGYLIGVLSSGGGGAVLFVLLAWVLLLVVVGWMVVGWWLERFVLTDKRVLLVSGIITRRVAMMPLARVTDMAYVQSPLGMALNYGTFILESAGQDQALREIKPLPHPNELYLLFCQEMYDPGAVDPEAQENSPEGDHSAD